MTKFTHITAGVLTALAVSKFNTSIEPISLVAGAVLGSTLPDIDQSVKWLRHRGETHSNIMAITAFAICIYSENLIVFGVALGVLSHILLDLFNGKGCELLWPFSKKNFRIIDIKYNGITEHRISTLMIICILYLISTNYVEIKIIAKGR